jgi:hypothetical protein
LLNKILNSFPLKFESMDQFVEKTPNSPPGGRTIDGPSSTSPESKNKSLVQMARNSSSSIGDAIPDQYGPNVQEGQPDATTTSDSTQEIDIFEVAWDNDGADPLCPHNISQPRKWIIVVIISLASLCVSVFGVHLRKASVAANTQLLHLALVLVPSIQQLINKWRQNSTTGECFLS